jgi:hypothetical protein
MVTFEGNWLGESISGIETRLVAKRWHGRWSVASWLGMASTDGNGDSAGGVECSSCPSARWGRGLGARRVAFFYWGSRAVPG